MHLKCSAFAGTCVMHSNRKHPISQKKKKKLVTFNDLVNSQTHYKLMSLSSRSENLIFNRLFFIFYISPQLKGAWKEFDSYWWLIDFFFFVLHLWHDENYVYLISYITKFNINYLSLYFNVSSADNSHREPCYLKKYSVVSPWILCLCDIYRLSKNQSFIINYM